MKATIPLLALALLLGSCSAGDNSNDERAEVKLDRVVRRLDRIEFAIRNEGKLQDIRDKDQAAYLRRIWLQGVPGESGQGDGIRSALAHLAKEIQHQGKLRQLQDGTRDDLLERIWKWGLEVERRRIQRVPGAQAQSSPPTNTQWKPER